MLYSEMTDKIINSFYKVYNVLGYGFLEKVYENKAQLINYRKATNKQVGLLFNFGKKPDFKRAIFSNERRGISETEASNPRESAQSAASAFYSS
jgi:hypothetical protein